MHPWGSPGFEGRQTSHKNFLLVGPTFWEPAQPPESCSNSKKFCKRAEVKHSGPHIARLKATGTTVLNHTSPFISTNWVNKWGSRHAGKPHPCSFQTVPRCSPRGFASTGMDSTYMGTARIMLMEGCARVTFTLVWPHTSQEAAKREGIVGFTVLGATVPRGREGTMGGVCGD